MTQQIKRRCDNCHTTVRRMEETVYGTLCSGCGKGVQNVIDFLEYRGFAIVEVATGESLTPPTPPTEPQSEEKPPPKGRSTAKAD